MRFLRPLAAAVLLAAPALAPAAASAKTYKHITIATEGAYAPYNMHAPDGKLIGFEIDLGNDLCARMKITCTWVAQDWDSMIPALNAGKFDAIMDGMSITPARLKVIAFSRNYSQSPTVFLVKKNGPLAKMPDTGLAVSLDNKAAADKAFAAIKPILKGKTVGVQVATIQLNMLNKYLKDTVTIRSYKTTQEHDLDLAAGRIDAALASTAYFVSTLSRPGGNAFVEVGPHFTGGLLGAGTGVGMRKSDPELKVMFDKAINAAIKDGTVKKLSLKWFKVDISPAS
ncbi:MAG: transporter substrate-binding domain-containing protein [Rhodospirillales bacterium]|nr:transporter substrate-binding domain-containing protein [Rhodospirillales bacterium]